MSERCEEECLTSDSIRHQVTVTQVDEKPYECGVCKMRFRHSNSLAIHLLAHTQDKPHECDVCLMRFNQSNELVKHKKAHTGLGYECDVCRKILSRVDCLVKHRRTHTKDHECDVCFTTFSEPSELIGHKNLHTGENLYECNVCWLGFFELDLLLKHKRAHNSDRFYKCDLCPRAFFEVKDLDWHKKEHLLCNSCNKGIFKPEELQEHFGRNKNNGKYVCIKCYQHFANFTKLVEHIARIHGNDAKYLCSFCQELESTEPTGLEYICCICDVVFDVPRELEAHMVNHATIH